MDEQSRETGNIVYTRRRHSKQKHNIMCVCHNYAQTKTNNVNKIWTLLQTTGGKDEPNISHIIWILSMVNMIFKSSIWAINAYSKYKTSQNEAHNRKLNLEML
jgi:hypothetical protein